MIIKKQNKNSVGKKTKFLNHIIKNLCLVFLVLSSCLMAFSQQVEKTRILFVVDCSYNMYEKWQSESKIKITQSLVSNIVDSLSTQEGVECALRVFGSEKDYSTQDCEDSRLLVPFYRLNTDALKSKLKGLVPKGTSAVSNSLEKIRDDFPNDKHCRNIVIMILNNIDRCGGNITETSKNLQKQGVCLKPFIIGINKGMKEFYQNAGSYYEANNEVEFSKIMNKIIKQALHNTSVQVNLLDSYLQSTETFVPITFIDSKSKQTRYSFIHSFNSNGISDTIFIDPLSDYDIIVHTIPPVEKDNITIEAGSHTVIPMKTPQGSLLIKFSSEKNDLNIKPYKTVIKRVGDKQIINAQQLNKKEKYLVGKYDLEVLSLPRLCLDSVEITQSSLTTIEVPLAGILSLEKKNANFTGSLFVRQKGKLSWVKNIEEDKIKENVELLPGEYILIAKEKTPNAKNITQEIKIESNKITKVTIK